MKRDRITEWIRRTGLAALAAAVPGLASAKMSLAVTFPDIVMEKVEPGSVINLRQLKGIPYVVTNRSDIAVEVVIEAETPEKGPGEAKESYEPLATPEWLRAVPSKFRLEPGEVASADIILSIPTDPQYVGRHFQVNLKARTLNAGGLALAVRNFVRFSVGTMGPEALKKEKDLKAVANVKLDLNPTTIRVDHAALGKKLDIAKLTGEVLKIVNTGKDTASLRFKSVTVEQNMQEKGYTNTPTPGWLTVKPAVLKVKPNQIQETKLFLEIPQDPANAGKKWLFLVRGELEGLSIPLEIHCRVYVTTD
jgi:hypothetical protein